MGDSDEPGTCVLKKPVRSVGTKMDDEGISLFIFSVLRLLFHVRQPLQNVLFCQPPHE